MPTYYHPGYLINTIDTGLYVPVEEIVRSLHRPCVFMFTQSGPYNKPVWVNNITEAKRIFGEETFNKFNSDYYSKESRLVETFLPHHGCYIVRLLPTDDFQVAGEQPERARVILSLDVTESTLTNYQRNLDGSFVLDESGNKVVDPDTPSVEGLKFFFHYRHVPSEYWNSVSTQELLTKMTTSPGTTSYNIMLINDIYPGKDGNRFGFNFYRDIEAYDSNFIDEIKAMMYTFKPKQKVYNNVQVTPMLDKYNSVFNNFSLKENTIDPNTNIELSIDKVLDNKYDNFNYEFVVNTDLIKEIGNLYLSKRQVIDGTETPGYIDGGILIDDPFMIDIINFKDFNGNPLIGTEKEAIEDQPELNPITKDTIIYLDGGKDGNKTDTTKEFLISEFCKATLFPDILNKAKYPITHIYDMGYTIDSKKKMLDFMAIRDDVSVTAVTQIFSIVTKIAMPVIVDTDNATSINFLKIGIVAPEYISGDGIITEVYLELENTDTGSVIYDGKMNFNILAATAPGEETYGDYWISMVDLISDVTPNIGNFRVRIKFIDNNGVESDFSLWKSFNVSDVQ
jgi:hypothetical protein